jgi:hypothetical protein
VNVVNGGNVVNGAIMPNKWRLFGNLGDFSSITKHPSVRLPKSGAKVENCRQKRGIS